MRSNIIIIILKIVSVFTVVDGATVHEGRKLSNITLSKEIEFDNTNDGIEIPSEVEEIRSQLMNESIVEITTTVAADKLKCNINNELLKEISQYRGIVHQIIDYVVNGPFKGKTFEMLAELTDTFGSRMTGSKSLEDSIDWMFNKFHEYKLENIHTEPVEAPHWIRNNESLFMMEPRLKKLALLGLGSSVATPVGGITAEAIVVESFEDLERNKEKVKDKIVIFNPSWENYGTTVAYRVNGASRAAKHGALASLIRSVTPFSINSPHTGWQSYADPLNKIPTACITVEDAQMFYRLQTRGQKIVLSLTMGAENLPNVITRNTVADLMGSEKPDEIVIVSGHLDSWDVGVGAMDDGGGMMISWSATAILKQMGLRPRRTVRTVLFTAEEQGLHGGEAYFKKHSHKADKYQLILESDIGTFDPKGLSFSGNNESLCIIQEILSLFDPINATQLSTPMRGGPDISFWKDVNVPLGSVLNDESKYFWFHHSEGDTLEVEDSPTLDRCAALWTAISFVAADISIQLPRD